MGDSSERTRQALAVRQEMPPDERRQSTRFRLRDARVTIKWEEGSEQFAGEGEVLNISGGGAALLVEQAPPAGQPVRVQLGHRLAAMEPLDARALAISTDPSGKHLVRVQFTHWVSLDTILEHHLERRLWQRFPVRASRARLTWVENGSERMIRGQLLNISGGGAAVIVDVPVPADLPIWFELESDASGQDPVESRLVVTSLDPSGSTIAHIRFIDPCPMLLFELAIHGSA
jgi:c-di-GMP-binding flagellar brake protein YcgR